MLETIAPKISPRLLRAPRRLESAMRELDEYFGTACAAAPLPAFLPCHRVLLGDGSLGGYAGGQAVKAALLEVESAA